MIIVHFFIASINPALDWQSEWFIYKYIIRFDSVVCQRKKGRFAGMRGPYREQQENPEKRNVYEIIDIIKLK